MGLQTQSPFQGQAYSMACMNSTSPFVGGSSRQAPPTGDVPLTSQKSIYSLTLEEFQNTLGEPGKTFGSMNMDELLKNIWTAEEGQAMAAAMVANADMSGLNKQASLQKQASVRGALGQKTVDEIWNNVYQGPINPADLSQSSLKQRELTFREVTLEDFLVKAGIVPEEDTGRNSGAGFISPFGGSVGMNRSVGNQYGNSFDTLPCNNVFPSPTSVLSSSLVDPHEGLQIDSSSLSFQPANLHTNPHQSAGLSQHGQLLKQSPTVGAADIFASNPGKQTDNAALVPTIGLGGLGSPVGGGIAASLNASTSYGVFSNPLSLVVPSYKMESPLSSDGTGTSQGSMPLSPVYHSGIPLRKRLAEGPLETVVERRQRRMIKNRESAARSRARKQAYTVELENELTELRAENAKLKQKQERAEKQLKKVLAVTHEIPKQQRVLKRTRTGPW